MKFEYPNDMDKEMIPLCDELNSIPGISTQFCCCGHGEVNKIENINKLILKYI